MTSFVLAHLLCQLSLISEKVISISDPEEYIGYISVDVRANKWMSFSIPLGRFFLVLRYGWWSNQVFKIFICLRVIRRAGT